MINFQREPDHCGLSSVLQEEISAYAAKWDLNNSSLSFSSKASRPGDYTVLKVTSALIWAEALIQIASSLNHLQQHSFHKFYKAPILVHCYFILVVYIYFY